MNLLCAAVDWGTSRFRLWLLDHNGSVTTHRSSDQGIITLTPEKFESVLEAHLEAAGAPKDLPVIVSGMAGSRQGWAEAAYLDLPASLDDLINTSVIVDTARRTVRILPGLAQREPARPNVMRGEETQLLGALGDDLESQIVCMPGTHSKWVQLESRVVRGFSTYMTGELFSVISSRSILLHAIEPDKFEEDAFISSVTGTLNEPDSITSQMFAIRAGQLLGFRKRQQGAAELSGLLIGAEIASARRIHGADHNVKLVASGDMARLYGKALELAGYEYSTTDAEAASINGLWRAAVELYGMSDAARASG